MNEGYVGGAYGLIKINLRTNSNNPTVGVSSATATWITCNGFNVNDIKIGLYNVSGATYADVFLKRSNGYSSVRVRFISNDARGSITRRWLAVNSSEVTDTTTTDKKTSYECWKTIEEAATELHG